MCNVTLKHTPSFKIDTTDYTVQQFKMYTAEQRRFTYISRVTLGRVTGSELSWLD